MKILYAGSPQASAITLQYLFENQAKYGFEISGVLSNPPTAKGRHKELTPTPVAAYAMEKGIPVFTPEHLDAACREEVVTVGADLLVSFAYGHIFGPKFLNLFKFGGINLHPSLLPKYRGCTPVNAAILNRDKETAFSIQTLALKMDEGDLLAQKVIQLNGSETGESLLNNAAADGAVLICDVIDKINSLKIEKAELKEQENGVKVPELDFGKKQRGEASYTGVITKEDGKINWSEKAETIEAKVRAYFPEPGCWCVENNLPLRILKAGFISADDSRVQKYADEEAGKVLEFVKAEGIYIKTGDGVLCVQELQRQGKKAMPYKDFMNGARDFIGTVLQ